MPEIYKGAWGRRELNVPYGSLAFQTKEDLLGKGKGQEKESSGKLA